MVSFHHAFLEQVQTGAHIDSDILGSRIGQEKAKLV